MAVSDLIPISRALISVSDKTGLVDLGKFLASAWVEIISTGGTAKRLRDAGLSVKDVSEHTGFPEMMDGRVKTLHPVIHGGILARRDRPQDAEAMAAHGIAAIDLVVVGLYPFEEAAAKGGDLGECIEEIDIGGPALIRAAAKNHEAVTVVTDPADYPSLIAEMERHDGATGLALRRKFAAAAFARTAAYDAAVGGWFARELGETFPRRVSFAGALKQVLRYGENPHQQAAFYVGGDDPGPGVATAEQLQGKGLSYNNLGDTDAAFGLVAEFEGPAIAIIKHANPCGVALGRNLREAYLRALACDPLSAYGGIIAANRTLDADTAEEIAKLFVEVVIAPELTGEARRTLAKKKNLRVLVTGGMPDPARPGMTLRSVAGGYLLQTRDSGRASADRLEVVTRKKPTEAQTRDLVFAFSVCKYAKSNAIVYAKDGATVGIGAGQMSRLDAARIAALKAADAARAAGEKKSRTEGSAAASDGFIPFTDALIAAAEAGAEAVIQPGGSIHDADVIAAADAAGLAMVFTGLRHFRH